MANCHSLARVLRHDWATCICNVRNHSERNDVHCQSLSALTIITRVNCPQKSWKWVLSAHYEGRDAEKCTDDTSGKDTGTLRGVFIVSSRFILFSLTWNTGRSRYYFIPKSTRCIIRYLVNMTLFSSRLIINHVCPYTRKLLKICQSD